MTFSHLWYQKHNFRWNLRLLPSFLQPVAGDETQASAMEQQLYTAVSSTSSWLDGVENVVLSDSLLLADNVEAQLEKQEVRSFSCT